MHEWGWMIVVVEGVPDGRTGGRHRGQAAHSHHKHHHFEGTGPPPAGRRRRACSSERCTLGLLLLLPPIHHHPHKPSKHLEVRQTTALISNQSTTGDWGVASQGKTDSHARLSFMEDSEPSAYKASQTPTSRLPSEGMSSAAVYLGVKAWSPAPQSAALDALREACWRRRRCWTERCPGLLVRTEEVWVALQTSAKANTLTRTHLHHSFIDMSKVHRRSMTPHRARWHWRPHPAWASR